MKNELENPIEQKKKKNFFLSHLFDFLLLAALSIGTASMYIVRAVSNANNANQDVVAKVLFEGNLMEIKDSKGKNRNPFALSTVNDYEEIVIAGRHSDLTLGIKHNAIAVVHSGCPGQECVHEGWVSTPNHPIICAHNGIFIEVQSSNSGEIIIG